QAPKMPIGYAKMGLSMKLQGKPKDAAGYYGQAFALAPKDLRLLGDYVFALGASKDTAKAEKILLESVEKDPKNPMVHELEGRFQALNKRPEASEAAYLKAISLAPDSPAPYYGLGMLYASQNKLPAAEERFRKAVEKNDKSVAAHTILGVVLNGQNKIDEANKQYRRALELAPKNALAANNLAANLADRGGNLDEALKFAQVAREAAPEDGNVGDTLGWIYYRKGLFDTALPIVSDAARKQDRNPVIRYHLGMILAKKGNSREAAAELRAALAIDPKFHGSEEARKTLGGLK
ncbi:MAG TPA: tetratricopeptide repeat protein, partial [Candidatus Deferrimicrobiaceae bacterium]